MDWADGKARDWLEHHMTGDDEGDYASLAAMLREVDHTARTPVASWESVKTIGDKIRAYTLDEVRRVVEEISEGEYCDQGKMARLILSRLEALK